ncbi:hypothetical protein BDZ90DRAFT_282071 [Jaminaea rosea]|uniref:Uncharacterized protein n=1 Tax=Jaminaea rosea TaxID=1569628 RepID=A0A316UHK6_9BASI|nr:hypothetical protein BDZ90DRAFT_282071 [Jaminaea rosea]PWN24742.1 hypothetical protein BDZ90DRAFT_282071 [Jaminaea rosea]
MSGTTPTAEPGVGDASTDSVPHDSDSTVLTLHSNSNMMSRVLLPFAGVCPPDLPLRTSSTMARYDRRLLGPLTLRFKAQGRSPTAWQSSAQDQIRRTIWTEVQRLATVAKKQCELPAIVFDEAPESFGEGKGCIDLVFRSPKALDLMRYRLHCFTLADTTGTRLQYRSAGWTGTLPGSVFIFDCLKLPVTPADSEAVLDSFKTMASDIGTMLGLGHVELKGSEFELTDKSTGTVRGYIKLHPKSLSMPFSTFISYLPTHFLWHGAPYTLQYSGRDLHKEAAFSQSYPLGGDASHDQLKSTASILSPESKGSSEDEDPRDNVRKRSRS